MRRVKRILTNQNRSGKFYPHSLLTITLQMTATYGEAEKFASIWCDSDPNTLPSVQAEVVALKEIFEVENNDDMVWMVELLSNKHVAENIDRLLYNVVKR
jgi:hypothetical protein